MASVRGHACMAQRLESVVSVVAVLILCASIHDALRPYHAGHGESLLIDQAIRTSFCPDSDSSELHHSRPLIGILSQPGDGDGGLIIRRKGWKAKNVSYIAASYVKFVEMGGARAVPLIYNEPEDTLSRKFAAINGILLPGGSASLQDGPFYATAKKLFQMALEENDKGDYFPIFGTCLGFELLTIIISQNHNILERFSARAQPAPLYFCDEQAKQRNMFKWFPEMLTDRVSAESLAMENHQYGISPQKFCENTLLSSFFRVLTTSPDRNKKIYVSTVEGRKYPVTGVQWHPEKNAFEWGLSTIPHSGEAIQLTQSVANFLVSEARRSCHRPSKEEEEQFLIYNYSPFYTGKDGYGLIYPWLSTHGGMCGGSTYLTAISLISHPENSLRTDSWTVSILQLLAC